MTSSRFKIIKENDEEFPSSFREYLQYLSQIKQSKDPDLWRFFKISYFHDSPLVDLKFNPKQRVLSFELSCLNIRHKNDKLFDKFGFCTMEFRCIFREVISIQIDFEDDENTWPDRGSVSYFDCCEIETLVDPFEQIDEDEDVRHSLIILTSNPKTYISVIFRSLDVWPVEPGAFYQMLTSGQYVIPMYQDDPDLK